MNKHIRGGKRLAGATTLLIATGLISSCESTQSLGLVSMHQYEEALASAKQSQTEYFDLDADYQRLQIDYDDLQAQMRDEGMRQLSANLTDEAYDKLSELERQLSAMNRPMKDVEKFQLSDGYLYMIQDRLLFESGKADLGPDGTKALMEISMEIAAQPHGTIWVRGHTDSDPVKKPATLERFPHGNLQLSAARAVAVGALLVESKSIKSASVRVMGFGPHEPVAANDSADNKRMNRRVEIYVSNPEG
ncbi:MAG TPA: OmpA family protein [Planctomycetes bacterium]|nr:OmpA family protein [Planctomycetota bacterium]HIK60175.1 OmpA family protein [Planctomycetota bacterium]